MYLILMIISMMYDNNIFLINYSNQSIWRWSSYLSYVHPYWKTFEAPNPFLHFTLGFFYIIFMFCALVGNGAV